uniref:Uncharacterized protein n=1 Tax=Loa loa TaxID=7209 RepID=E9L814_LOALO|nr:hypothetical protein [Loa loa]
MQKRSLDTIQGTGYGIKTKLNALENDGYDRMQNRPFDSFGYRTKTFHTNRYSTNRRHSHPRRTSISTAKFLK